MNEKYKLFGLDENCTDEELEKAYQERRAVYAEDRFLEGEAGNVAAKKLTELDGAYFEIKAHRRDSFVKTEQSEQEENAYSQVEKLIKEGKIREAQQELDNFNERNAEWHYLQAVVFFKKNWNNESKKQLEIAMQMDPDNQKYKNSYQKLESKINTDANKNFTSYTTGNGTDGHQYEEPRQMGGDFCCQWCCEMAICNTMLNCCCNSCG